MATTTTDAAAIGGVDVAAYQIPTATDEEADGTLVWGSTSVVVVEVRAEGFAASATHTAHLRPPR